MKNKNKAIKRSCFPKGFTLIELLVVVLIIGILAAVAVPQYQKAVAKSRMTEVIVNLKTFGDAYQVCELNKGEACTLDEMDITPSNAVKIWKNAPGAFETDTFFYAFGEDINAHAMKSLARSNEEDMCICYLNDGRFVVSQDVDNCTSVPAKFDYATLLNLPDVSDEGICMCC